MAENVGYNLIFIPTQLKRLYLKIPQNLFIVSAFVYLYECQSNNE